jgi:hypothetical protein
MSIKLIIHFSLFDFTGFWFWGRGAWNFVGGSFRRLRVWRGWEPAFLIGGDFCYCRWMSDYSSSLGNWNSYCGL